MIYQNCKVYGPYTREDGRQHIVIFPKGAGSGITVSYPRYLVEKMISRHLKDNEDVHHKNGDFTDNRLENLEVIEHHAHCVKHQQKYFDADVVCVECGKVFFMSAKAASNRVRNGNRGKRGPFCSRQCSGKYGRRIQQSAEKEISRVESPKVGEALLIGNPEPSPKGKV